MTNAAAKKGIIEHIGDGPGRIRYLDAHPSAPNPFRSKQGRRADMLQNEGDALNRLFLAAQRARRHDTDAAKQLLRQAPMFGRAPTANISRPKQLRDDHPRVFKNLVLSERRERDRRIDAAAHAPEPPLRLPAREPFGRCLAVQMQCCADIADGHQVAGLLEDLTELGTALGAYRKGVTHRYNL